MKGLSKISLLAGIVGLVVAVIIRMMNRPISIIAQNVDAAGCARLTSALLLLSIAAALQEKKKEE